jgi:hypothetical protein
MYSEAVMRARAPFLALLAVSAMAWAVLSMRSAPAYPSAAVAPRRAASPPAVRDIGDLERASARLRTDRSAGVVPLAAPVRNPFEFAIARPKPAVARPTPAAALAAVTPTFLLPPPLPSVTLVGLVDRDVNGRVIRTAVLSFGGQLHYVEAGGRLGGAYEVVAVGPNAVDLLALETNTPRRLVQR